MKDKIKPGDKIFVFDRWGIKKLIAEKVTAKQIKVVTPNDAYVTRVELQKAVVVNSRTNELNFKIAALRQQEYEILQRRKKLEAEMFG